MGDTLQGDPLYGRLFTLRDVRLLMHHAAKRTAEQAERLFASLGNNPDIPTTAEEAIAQVEELLGDVTARGELTFPVDEPLFLLRGSDRATVPTIGAYAVECEALDAPRAYLTSIISTGSAMFDWQQDHRDRVQIPPDHLKEPT